MGPAIATRILLSSSLKDRYELLHFNNTINKRIETQGRFGLVKIFKSIRLYLKFWKQVRRDKPNVILIPISQTTIGFIKDFPIVFLSGLYGQRSLVQLRGSNLKKWLSGANSIVRFLFRIAMSKVDGAIVLGEKLRYLFDDYFSHEQIFVIPNGGDFCFPLKQNNKSTTLNVLYLANIYESKGAGILLDAILSMKEVNSRCDFTFVGGWRNDRDFKDAFLRKVKSAEQSINVIPPLGGEDKWQYFADADIFVFTPIEPEGHPWVIVEAMAAGLPIISTDQGAITESVIDGKNGYIVPAGNPAAIREKLNILISNPILRKKMGEKSREIYLMNFTLDKMVQKYIDAFENIRRL